MPKLQLALDNKDMLKSLKVVQRTADAVDVIEVGTILAIENGMEITRIFKNLYPTHTLLADIRIIKAGGKLAELAFDSGADWVTVISSASNSTIASVMKEANKRMNKEVQIEINNSFTKEQMFYWKQMGIKQVVYHRSDEVLKKENSWSKIDFNNLEILQKEGFSISVTGGLDIEDIQKFKEFDIYCFIIGRNIANAKDPLKVAKEYKKEIMEVFQK
ncbi:orotidine 5'-phosphate decarboxylase / HUMPS family protein [Mammaliicoccus lentus]|uniref:orotidine 5'-phosphate decarboxylase / HUMPS family protein n=1 Tax=Mammaliicoccus lentus TaxID=42858 RepID=UPI003CF8036B